MRIVTRNQQLTKTDEKKYWVEDKDVVVNENDRNLAKIGGFFASYATNVDLTGKQEESAFASARRRMMIDKRQEAYEAIPQIDKDKAIDWRNLKAKEYELKNLNKEMERMQEKLQVLKDEAALALHNYTNKYVLKEKI